MLIDIETGRAIDRIPYRSDFDALPKRLTAAEFDQMIARINELIDESGGRDRHGGLALTFVFGGCEEPRCPQNANTDNFRWCRKCGVDFHKLEAVARIVMRTNHRSMGSASFVPPDFVVPSSLETPRFRLEQLGPQHNEADYAAWTSSVEHIRSTPGYPDGNWPDGRSIEDNLRDLRRHADDFEKRRGFTYTVLDLASADVIGCVYIYPEKGEAHRAGVQSWVRASRAELDVPLWRAVSAWLETSWPFAGVTYDDRPTT